MAIQRPANPGLDRIVIRRCPAGFGNDPKAVHCSADAEPRSARKTDRKRRRLSLVRSSLRQSPALRRSAREAAAAIEQLAGMDPARPPRSQPCPAPGTRRRSACPVRLEPALGLVAAPRHRRSHGSGIASGVDHGDRSRIGGIRAQDARIAPRGREGSDGVRTEGILLGAKCRADPAKHRQARSTITIAVCSRRHVPIRTSDSVQRLAPSSFRRMRCR
jgi:hypothetical protein